MRCMIKIYTACLQEFLSEINHLLEATNIRNGLLEMIRIHVLNMLIIKGYLRSGLSWFNWWVYFAPEFQCCYFCESSCLFYLSFISDFYVSKIMHL